MYRTASLFAALLLAFGAAAQSDGNSQKLDPGFLSAFSEYDSNGDGVVTLAEVEAIVDPSYVPGVRACDTDADQRLSLDEYNICNGTAGDPSASDAPR